MPFGVALLLIGLLSGYVRLINMYPYGHGIFTGISTWLEGIGFTRLLPIHPHLIVLGFIGTLIYVERIYAAPEARIRSILYIGLIFHVTGVLTMAIYGFTGYIGVAYTSLLVFHIPLATYIIYIYSLRRYIDRVSGALQVASQIPYISMVYTSMWTGYTDRVAYSLTILSYPILMILGERLALSRVGPRPIVRRAGVIYILTILYLATLTFSLYTSPDIYLRIVYTATLAVLVIYTIYSDPGLRAVSGDIHRFLRTHLIGGYAMLLAGIIVAPLSGLPTGANLYDLYIHLIGLGFIGSMLLGHGPIVLSGIRGVKPRYSYVPYAVLLASIGLRALLDILYWMDISILNILAGLSGLSTIIVVPIFLISISRGS